MFVCQESVIGRYKHAVHGEPANRKREAALQIGLTLLRLCACNSCSATALWFCVCTALCTAYLKGLHWTLAKQDLTAVILSLSDSFVSLTHA